MDTRINYYFFVFVAFLISVSACGADVKELIKSSSIKDIQLRVDKKIEHQYCQLWSMSNDDAKEYFLKAEIITGEIRHSVYDWGGCNQEGVLVANTGSYKFSINAGSTASLFIGDEEIIFGCKTNCKHIFDFGF